MLKIIKLKINIQDINTIAIIQTAFLGDVALALPLADKIKELKNDINILFVTTSQAAKIAEVSASFDEVIIYNKRGSDRGFAGIKRIAEILKSKKVDCVIAPHRSARTSVITYLTKSKYSVGFDKNALSFLYHSRVKYKFHLHELERYFSLLEPFNINILPLVPKLQLWNEAVRYVTDLKFTQYDIDKVEDLLKEIIPNNNNLKPTINLSDEALAQSDYNLILLAPGSKWETKKWKSEYFSELIKLLTDAKFKCILIGSDEDADLCDKIAESSVSISLAGKLTIPQTIYLMKNSNLVITNDSAPTHFTGLVNCPVITIYGPTAPEFGFAPWSSKSLSIGNNDLHCRPCAIHGSSKCPIRTHICMTSIKPEKVFLEALRILSD